MQRRMPRSAQCACAGCAGTWIAAGDRLSVGRTIGVAAGRVVGQEEWIRSVSPWWREFAISPCGQDSGVSKSRGGLPISRISRLSEPRVGVFPTNFRLGGCEGGVVLSQHLGHIDQSAASVWVSRAVSTNTWLVLAGLRAVSTCSSGLPVLLTPAWRLAPCLRRTPHRRIAAMHSLIGTMPYHPSPISERRSQGESPHHWKSGRPQATLHSGMLPRAPCATPIVRAQGSCRP